MAFSISDAVTRAQKYINETIAPSDAVDWANEFMSAIGSRWWRKTAKVYEAAKNIWYPLPQSFAYGVYVCTTIGIPKNLSLALGGASGATTWGYRVTAVNADGETAACDEVKLTNGPAALTSANYIAISWNAVAGATQYWVYRTTAGGTPNTTGVIATTASTSLNDTGLPAGGEEVPFDDGTGDPYEGYVISDRRIKFADQGVYVLTYVARPAAFTDVLNKPDLPDCFLDPLVKFLASRQRSRDNKNDPDALKWMAEFQADLSRIAGDFEDDSTPFRVRMMW